VRPKDPRPKFSPRPVSPPDKSSRSQHQLIDNWLDKRPDVRRVLDRVQHHIGAGTVSPKDVVLLAKKWADTLPPRRGEVKQLRDFMQLKLELDLAAVSRTRPRRRRRSNGKRPLP
jgi:hypothetical protein